MEDYGVQIDPALPQRDPRRAQVGLSGLTLNADDLHRNRCQNNIANDQFRRGKVDLSISRSHKARRQLWLERYSMVLTMTYKDNPEQVYVHFWTYKANESQRPEETANCL